MAPILGIQRELQNLTKIVMADVGCGDGRYSLEICKTLGDRVSLHCVDANQEMLKNLDTFLASRGITNCQTHLAPAEKLPFEDDSIDCVVTMNAIHHFKILEFLNEMSRIIIDDGYLFIYTRFRSQNKKNIWGKYFPLFNEKETRLFELNELEEEVKKTSDLVLQSAKLSKFERSSDIGTLMHQAENHHYSTFSLYEKEEFERSLSGFRRNLESNFGGADKVEWTEENSLLTIKKASR